MGEYYMKRNTTCCTLFLNVPGNVRPLRVSMGFKEWYAWRILDRAQKRLRNHQTIKSLTYHLGAMRFKMQIPTLGSHLWPLVYVKHLKSSRQLWWGDRHLPSQCGCSLVSSEQTLHAAWHFPKESAWAVAGISSSFIGHISHLSSSPSPWCGEVPFPEQSR